MYDMMDAANQNTGCRLSFSSLGALKLGKAQSAVSTVSVCVVCRVSVECRLQDVALGNLAIKHPTSCGDEETSVAEHNVSISRQRNLNQFFLLLLRLLDGRLLRGLFAVKFGEEELIDGDLVLGGERERLVQLLREVLRVATIPPFHKLQHKNMPVRSRVTLQVSTQNGLLPSGQNGGER